MGFGSSQLGFRDASYACERREGRGSSDGGGQVMGVGLWELDERGSKSPGWRRVAEGGGCF